MIIILINAVLTTIPSVLALAGNAQTGSFVMPHFPGSTINLRIDGLSAWFIIIINFTTINGALFGSGYLKSFKNSPTQIGMHWIFYMLFHISMIWVCMFDHGILFIVSWELMLVSSLMLVIFEFTNAKNLKAGLKYLINMHISVAFISVAFIWIHAETHSFNLSALANVSSQTHSLWIFILFAVGFAIKAGFLPFHTWLPDTDSTAPPHVAGVMSGVIVKLGIFGILRIISTLNHDLLIIGQVILSVSVLTALYGIINAAVKYDFNRSLAYCSMENIGIIGMGIGLGVIGLGTSQQSLIIFGFTGALLHVLNHSLFKSLLFFSAGSVYQQTKTRSIDRLGGLVKSMPVTTLFFLIGALAIGGLPPFNGFISEFLIYSGLFKALFALKGISNVILIILTIVGLVLVGGVSILAFTRLFGVIFLGKSRSKYSQNAVESSFIMHLPQYFIVLAMLSIAFFPQYYLTQCIRIIGSTFGTVVALDATLLDASSKTLVNVGKVSFYFISLFGALYLLRIYFTKNKATETTETWTCAYIAPISRAQYTGRSFSRRFSHLFSFITVSHTRSNELSKGKLYPKNQKFSSYYFDFFELYLVKPLLKRISYTMNYFQFIQNGKIQSYVIYSLIFILIAFIGTAIGLIK